MSILKAFNKTLFSEKWIDSRIHFLLAVMLLVVFFAAIYIALDFNEPMDKDSNKTKYFYYNEIPNNTTFQKIWNKIYMSFTTLTTLGFGDIYPIHPLSQLIIAIQTFLTFFLITDLVR